MIDKCPKTLLTSQSRSLCMHLWNTSWETGASHGVDNCPTLWIQWLWDILGTLSTHFVDLILMHSQSVSLGLLQFHMCSKKMALWEWRTVKKTSTVGIKAWCVHTCRINLKIWYVFLGITLFSLTYPFLGGRWGEMPEGLKNFTDPVIFKKSLGPLVRLRRKLIRISLRKLT